MAAALSEVLARGAARQVYRLLRLGAPLLRPITRHIGLERRASAVTALVRIGWNGSPVKTSSASIDIAPAAELRPGVACIGHPSAESGVGEALRATARSFAAAQVPFDLVGLDRYTTARLDDDSMSAHNSARLDRRINLLCDGLIGAEVALDALSPAALAGRYNIFRPFWELAKVPPSLVPSLACFQEIWAPSEFVRASFAECSDMPVLRMPVAVALNRVTPAPRSSYGLPEQAKLFLFAFDPCSFAARKNPLAAIEAFRLAFGKRGSADVGLVIKTLNAGPHAHVIKTLRNAIGGDERIHLIERTVSRDEMSGLLAACDGFVSLHRSEGFGFGLAEAMLLGKPVIGTAYSGNVDFLSEATGYPVPYTLVPVKPGEYPHHAGQVWADPDIAVAAFHMAAIVERPEQAAKIALAGKAFIETQHSPTAAGQLMRGRLTELGLLSGEQAISDHAANRRMAT